MSFFTEGGNITVDIINREDGRYVHIDGLIKWLKGAGEDLKKDGFVDESNVELIHILIKELVKLKNKK